MSLAAVPESEQYRADLGRQVEDLGDGGDVESVDRAAETAIAPDSMVSIVAWRVPVIRRRNADIPGSTYALAQWQSTCLVSESSRRFNPDRARSALVQLVLSIPTRPAFRRSRSLAGVSEPVDDRSLLIDK